MNFIFPGGVCHTMVQMYCSGRCNRHIRNLKFKKIYGLFQKIYATVDKKTILFFMRPQDNCESLIIKLTTGMWSNGRKSAHIVTAILSLWDIGHLGLSLMEDDLRYCTSSFLWCAICASHTSHRKFGKNVRAPTRASRSTRSW